MLGLTLLLSWSVLPQNGGGSLEAWMKDLEQRTAARRAHAAEVWSAEGPAWLAGEAHRLPALLEAAPEIQGPVLTTLEKAVAEAKAAAAYPALLSLLGKVMNPAGAERLFAQLGDLPVEFRPAAARAAIARGGPALWNEARALASGPPGPLRQAAAQALLLQVPPDETRAWAAVLTTTEGELAGLLETLAGLRARELPAGFVLPATLYASADAGLQRELARFLAVHPADDAQSFLAERALDPARPREERALFLTAFETGAKAFRWRDGERRMEEFLDHAPRSEASEDVAWMLWRLGSRSAKLFLLAEVEREARENPESYRAQLELARRQVDVGEHSDAFKNYKKTFEALEGTTWERMIAGDDYVWAARAAAGTRRSKEAGQWLEESGLNPVELALYKDQPEFASFLDKQPFKRLFGL